MTKVTKSGFPFHEFKKNTSTANFPNAFSDYIRSYGEVYFWEKGNFHVITKAQHAREILTSDAFSADRGSFFVSRMPNLDLRLIGDFFGVVKKMMVMSDDNQHLAMRKLASGGFEDHILERFSSKLQMTVQNLVKDISGKSHIEFVEKVAKKLPSIILADLFRIPEEDRSLFLKWSNTMTGFFGGASQYRNEDGIEVNEAALALKTYFTGLIEVRKKNPGDDYVSITLKAQDILKLTDDEVISQLIMMLVAGMATTTDQINNIMFLLASNPSMQKEVRENLLLVPQMLEECKRFDPAVTFIFRVARKETMIGNQPILPGDVIFISSHAISRDLPSEQFPEELNIHRKSVNFAYGHGPHYCIGAKLARLEMNALFTEIMKSLPPFGIDEDQESVRDHYSLSFSGFKSLHIKTL